MADATGTARPAGPVPAEEVAAPAEGVAAPGEGAAAPARSRTAVRFLPKLSTAPLKVRNYRLLVIGQGVSEFGNAFGLVALPLLIFARGGSAAQIGLVASGFGVARILTTPLSGLLIDRLGAWRVMMASDLGRMALAGGLTAVAANGRGSLVLIGVLAAPIGLFSGLFAPAELSVMPSVLPADDLHAGNSLNSMVSNLAALLGPNAAGLVVAFVNPATAFGVDAATFAVSALSLLAIGRTRPAAAVGRKRAQAAGTGPTSFLGLLRGSPILRDILVVTVVANLTMGGLARVALPALATKDLKTGAEGLGGLVAAFAAGSLAGGLVAAGLTGLRSRGRAAMFSGLILATAILLTPLAGLAGALIMLFVAGAAATVTNVMVVTTVQQGTPPELLGRTMSALMFCGMGLFPFSVAVVGFLVDTYGSRSFFFASGVSLAAAFCFGLSRRAIRNAAD